MNIPKLFPLHAKLNRIIDSMNTQSASCHIRQPINLVSSNGPFFYRSIGGFGLQSSF